MADLASASEGGAASWTAYPPVPPDVVAAAGVAVGAAEGRAAEVRIDGAAGVPAAASPSCGALLATRVVALGVATGAAATGLGAGGVAAGRAAEGLGGTDAMDGRAGTGAVGAVAPSGEITVPSGRTETVFTRLGSGKPLAVPDVGAAMGAPVLKGWSGRAIGTTEHFNVIEAYKT